MTDFKPGASAPRSGMYRCFYCGPGGHAANAASTGYAPGRIGELARATKIIRFFRKGATFGRCPNCNTLPDDQTHWRLEKETDRDESTAAPTTKRHGRQIEGVLISAAPPWRGLTN